ncbi:MAG: peroxiredoxin family protein [Planctomycetota bacterium]
MSIRFLGVLLPALLIVVPASGHRTGQDDPLRVINEYQEAFAAWVSAVSTAAPERRQALLAERPRKDDVARTLLALADDVDGDRKFIALQWVTLEAEADELRTQALHRLVAAFGDDARMQEVLPGLERDPHDRARTVLEALRTDSPHPEVRAAAAMGLASWLLRFEPEDGRPRAEALLEEVARIESDLPYAGGGLLRDRAAARLFELRQLAVGSPVPDIVGTDLKGEPLRLSDHRGRVVLLPFWAHWCRGCMQQAVHERALLEDLADRPFVILGVNADPSSPEQVLALNEQRDVAWRSFRNGSAGMRGPITRRWNIETMPTTYLIDHEGVIVHKWVAAIARPDELREAVEAAVSRAERDRAATSPAP